MERKNLLLQKENKGSMEDSALQIFFNTQFSVEVFCLHMVLPLHTNHRENVMQTLALPGKVMSSP